VKGVFDPYSKVETYLHISSGRLGVFFVSLLAKINAFPNKDCYFSIRYTALRFSLFTNTAITPVF
jgi:hypothetical protein